MKRILIFFLFALVISSCVENDERKPNEDNLVKNLTSGLWEISFFTLAGIERGKDFEGNNFSFLPNGQVEAYRGTQLLAQGLWNTNVISGRIEMQTSFSSIPKFENLNANWYQVSIINNRITLRKINSEDYLIFVKR